MKCGLTNSWQTNWNDNSNMFINLHTLLDDFRNCFFSRNLEMIQELVRISHNLNINLIFGLKKLDDGLLVFKVLS